MTTRRFVRGIALATVLSLSVISAGCFGKFQLTRMIYDLNKSVEDKYVRSAVTWGFVIIPVYGFSAFLDVVVFNVVEFWTGENPMTVTKVHREGADTVAMTLFREGKGTVATLDRFRDGKKAATLVIRDGGDGVVRASLFEGGRELRSSVARLNADGSVSVNGRAAGAAFAERHAPTEVTSVRARVEGALVRAQGVRG
jgi:hypothetical protein